LKALQDQEFEPHMIIMNRNTPFQVVIIQIEDVILWNPGTTPYHGLSSLTLSPWPGPTEVFQIYPMTIVKFYAFCL
jgi:hypothetical protein